MWGMGGEPLFGFSGGSDQLPLSGDPHLKWASAHNPARALECRFGPSPRDVNIPEAVPLPDRAQIRAALVWAGGNGPGPQLEGIVFTHWIDPFIRVSLHWTRINIFH